MVTYSIRRVLHIEWTTRPVIAMTAHHDILEIDIQAGQKFFLVRSSEDNGNYYVVKFSEASTSWNCSICRRRHCKHSDAAQAYIVEQAKKQDELAEAAQVAPAILGELAQDIEQHIDETLSEVLVWMDIDGFYGLVCISGQPTEYLYIEQIREQYPIHRVISLEELAAFKRAEAEKYRAMYPGDFYDVA